MVTNSTVCDQESDERATTDDGLVGEESLVKNACVTMHIRSFSGSLSELIIQEHEASPVCKT